MLHVTPSEWKAMSQEARTGVRVCKNVLMIVSVDEIWKKLVKYFSLFSIKKTLTVSNAFFVNTMSKYLNKIGQPLIQFVW